MNDEREVFTLDKLFTDEVFPGFYVARDAEVTFSNLEVKVEQRTVKELMVDATAMKTDYLVGEELDLTGLQVTALYSDDTEEVLLPTDYIVTGFDSNKAGTNTITLNFGGMTEELELTITPLTLTRMEIKYFPAKTTYYPGDSFDPEGFVVIGEYEHGLKTEELVSDRYRFSIEDEVAESDYRFEEPGMKEVTVTSVEAEDVSVSFDVAVKDASLVALDIRRLPVKTRYFIGDDLDLAGINVYALYSDENEVRLMAGEFDASELDTSTPGNKTVTLTHKGVSVSFTIEVKEKELEAIELSSYPKTSYFVGEIFERAGLEVSKVYDNGEREPLGEEYYTLDSSGVNPDRAGVYQLQVIPDDPSIEAISFQVTVREYEEPQWHTTRFGQSTSAERNYVDVSEQDSVKVVALEGGGKITGDHDGISFYYTEVDAEADNFVLSADIKVIDYAKTPHDGQESFGIMARDAINPTEDASVFASNIAAVGGFSGGTREENGTQALIRTGVLTPDGEGSEGIQKRMLRNERPNATNTEQDYRLTLAKTNSGYMAKLNQEDEVIFFMSLTFYSCRTSEFMSGFMQHDLPQLKSATLILR